MLSATILPHMSENCQEIKPWRGLEIFETLYQELEKVNFGVP